MNVEIIGIIALSAISGTVAGFFLAKVLIRFSDKKLYKQMSSKLQNQEKQDFIIDGKKYKLAEIINSPPPQVAELDTPEPSPLPDLPSPKQDSKSRFSASDLMRVKRK